MAALLRVWRTGFTAIILEASGPQFVAHGGEVTHGGEEDIQFGSLPEAASTKRSDGCNAYRQRRHYVKMASAASTTSG